MSLGLIIQFTDQISYSFVQKKFVKKSNYLVLTHLETFEKEIDILYTLTVKHSSGKIHKFVTGR